MNRPTKPFEGDGDGSSLLGAHALNATEEFDRARVERALAQGELDRDELASFVETAALLGWSAAETPPPELRASVLDAITSVRQEPPVVAAPVVPPRRVPRLSMLSAAAAVAAIALAGFALGTVTGRATGGERADDLALALAGAERVVTLQGPGAGTVRVARHGDGSLTVVTDGVPAPADGMAYELWTIDGSGTPQPAGLFGANGKQSVATIGAGVAPGAATAKALAITQEPAGGSSAPTSEIRYQGQA